jgi:hypothetical protein
VEPKTPLGIGEKPLWLDLDYLERGEHRGGGEIDGGGDRQQQTIGRQRAVDS